MEFTQKQKSEIISSLANGEEGFKQLIQLGLESLMQSERQLYNEEYHDLSNGFRDRRVYHNGMMFEIRVPRCRHSNFYPLLLGVLKDQESELHRLVCSLYSEGLTTKQVGRITEEFYGKHYSKAQVSRLLDGARQDVSLWLKRTLDHHYMAVYIDATYVTTKRGDSVSNEAYYVMLGVKEDRTREVLSIVNFPTESATNWSEVFSDIKQRGVETIDLFVCDGLTGIKNSISSAFPSADIQLCTVHLKRNILNKIKPIDKKEITTQLKHLFSPDQMISPNFAFTQFQSFIDLWRRKYPSLSRYKDDHYRYYFTYFQYEKQIRSMIYTTNWIERLNRDFKRVLKMRAVMPNSDSVILLMANVAMNKTAFAYPIHNFSDNMIFTISQ